MLIALLLHCAEGLQLAPHFGMHTDHPLRRPRRSQSWTRPSPRCRCHLAGRSFNHPTPCQRGSPTSILHGGLGLGLVLAAAAAALCGLGRGNHTPSHHACLLSSDLQPPTRPRPLAASVALTLSMPSFAQGIGDVDESTINETAAQTGAKTTTTESSSNANEFSSNVCASWTHACQEMRHRII